MREHWELGIHLRSPGTGGREWPDRQGSAERPFAPFQGYMISRLVSVLTHGAILCRPDGLARWVLVSNDCVPYSQLN